LALGGDIRKILTLVAEKAEQKSRNIRVVFRNFDEDKSGTLNYKEFRQGLIGLGIVLSDSDFDALVKVLDNDGNGEINYGEFVEDMKAVDQQVGGFFGDPGRHKKKMDDYKENQRVAEVHNAHAAGAGRTGAEILATVKRKCEEKSKQIRKIFRTFDENHDGKVTYAEFRQGLRGLGFQLPDADFNALVKHVDDDGSGALDYNEFVAELHLHEPQTGGQIGGSGTHKKRMAELAAKQNENEHDWSVADVAATLASIKQKCEQKSKHIRKVRKAPSWPRSWANFSLL
jgi:Ca2+-binding EF-hand superfamily protein